VFGVLVSSREQSWRKASSSNWTISFSFTSPARRVHFSWAKKSTKEPHWWRLFESRSEGLWIVAWEIGWKSCCLGFSSLPRLATTRGSWKREWSTWRACSCSRRSFQVPASSLWLWERISRERFWRSVRVSERLSDRKSPAFARKYKAFPKTWTTRMPSRTEKS